MALSYKKLIQDDEERLEFIDQDEEDSKTDDSSDGGHVTKEDHPTVSINSPKRRRGRFTPCCSTKCSITSWSVAFMAVTAFTVAILISLFFALFLTAPDEDDDHVILEGAVATDSWLCSNISGQILKDGGSAIDAAITALLCVGTIYPESSGIGGGGFMTVFDAANQTVTAFNFRETAPSASTVDMFVGDPELATNGGLSVGVPGELAGMKLVHDRYGKLPWADLFKPVIELARNGYPLTSHTASAIKSVNSSLYNNPRFQDWYYLRDGTLKSEGDLVQRPKFADTLQKIATEGPSVFYRGSIANEIINEIQDSDGIMTLEDLSSYEARTEEPVYIRYRDFDVYSHPLPAGGPQMLFILNVMENMNLDPSSRWKNVTYQHLVETFKYSFALRSNIGDPYCSQCDTKAMLNLQNNYLLSEKYALHINNSISNVRTFPPEHYNGSYFPGDSGTTHVSVIGTDGMAVAITSSVNTLFGSKVITPSGIVLNNDMDDFSSPNITNAYGLRPSEANFIHPGKRALSSTCPTVMLKRNKKGRLYAYLSLGAAGGTRIVTSTAQVALEVTAFRESVTTAVESKRLHSQLYPNNVLYEEGYPSNITSYLRSLGHILELNRYKSEVQAVAQEVEGTLSAHSDSRKGGQAGSYQFAT